ncbi:ATP-binding protein [Streptomyces tagetis]|uniref:ATP-binding protein n=1 Tax=Streptomyces tagetis TaxID=2820809 RepID=A0A940XGW0_9ACTN|nr:ATP-binding protein [Streptomyces sp. RG38]MBQ0826937.1 ATP-binding protein [Streptomyces sp. RG38]
MSDSDPTEPAARYPGAERRRWFRPRRPAEARRTVERVVTECCHARHTPCDAGALSDAVLVASELTTNAILHAGGVTDFRVEVVVGPGVRLSVSDRSSALPVLVEPAGPQGRRRLGGRGWPIVCRLAREVRVADLPAGGKCITVVVPLS